MLYFDQMCYKSAIINPKSAINAIFIKKNCALRAQICFLQIVNSRLFIFNLNLIPRTSFSSYIHKLWSGKGFHGSIHKLWSGNLSYSTAYVYYPENLSHSTAHVCYQENLSHSTAHVCYPENLSHSTAHVYYPENLSHSTAHIYYPENLSHSTAYVYYPDKPCFSRLGCQSSFNIQILFWGKC